MKDASVATYVTSLPEDAREKFEEARSIVREEIPGATEVISYGVLAFKLEGKYVVYLAGYKNHISIYPSSDGMIKAIGEADKYRTGKGTLQFPLSEPLPLSLIKKVVKYLTVEFKERQSKK